MHLSLIGQKLSFASITSEQGLSQNTVLTIAQDSQGFMWFGTRYGLNRYDGYQFITYKNNPLDSFSISNNYINAILYDTVSGLWIGTEDGLNHYDPVSDRFGKIILASNASSLRCIINNLSPEKNGLFWAATSNGLFLINGKTRQVVSANKLGILDTSENKNIRVVFKDTKGYLWVAIAGKLIRIKKINGKTEKKIFLYDKNNPTGLSDDFVTAIYEAENASLWIGTLNGLNLYNPVTESFSHFLYHPLDPGSISNNNIRTIASGSLGKLWIGTQEGLNVLDLANQHFSSYKYNAEDPESINQNSIHSIYRDASGSMWVGTFYSGVNIAYNPAFEAPLVQHSYVFPAISSNIISSAAIDEKNNLWIGTEGGGLNYVDRVSNTITQFKYSATDKGSLSSNLVKKIFIDKDKNIWIGTHGGGLNVFDKPHRNFKQALSKLPFLYYRQSEIVSFWEDSENIFWIGAHSGLYAFNRSGTELTPSAYQPALTSLQNKNISGILEDRNGNLWIGTLNGVYLFNRKTKSLAQIPVKSPIDNINCIVEDAKGTIWVGLYYGGLAQYDIKQRVIVPAAITSNLPNENVLGILEDSENNLWISTGNGLVKYNPEKSALKVYTKSDGLPGNEFNYNAFFKDGSGEMFFGGMHGLISFFPDKIKENSTKAPLVFTGLEVLNNPVKAHDSTHILQHDINYVNKFELGHNQNTFTISFALLNFIKSTKNSYAYKLQEVHKDWIRTAQPVATFTNLAPGTYTLLIKAANNDGIWSASRAIKITIRPPIWATWWAYLCYALLVLLIAFLIIRFFYLRALLTRDHELHELKLNFFTNISHEIRTHLTLIKTPVERMEQDNKQNPGLIRQLANLKNNTNRLLHLVSELMDFRKAETNSMKLRIGRHELIAFLTSVYETFEDLSLERNIHTSFVHPMPERFVYFDNEQMAKVIFNLLSNAFKFTPDGGRVELFIEEDENAVMIHITDNGTGIAPQYLDKLFTNFFQVEDNSSQNTGYGIGLALSKAIVTLHKGTLTVNSTPANAEKQGHTRFTITLLKGNSHFAQETVLTEKDQEKEWITTSATGHTENETTLNEFDDGAQFNVLIVEDNEALRQLIKEALSSYRVNLCEDGAKGWDTATQTIPDIIISDVMMPEMDGITLCQKLKTDDRTSHIPVILLTAKSTQTDQIAGLSKGADAYITKPFSTEILKLNVKNLLLAREKMRHKFSQEFTISPRNIVIQSADEEFLKRLIDITEEYLDDPDFGVERLSIKIAMSQSVLYKKLRAVTDMSVNEFIKSIRLKKAAQLLMSKQYNVSEVSLMVGFYDRKYFSREFKKQFRVTPSEYIRTETGA